MPPDDGDLERLERERQDTDRLYNEALTVFDAALVREMLMPDAAVAADLAPPTLPGGWRGRLLQVVQEWLMPWMDRKQAFNTRASAAVDALISQQRERAASFERFQSTLVVFLQHITAFVDTKDRQLMGVVRHEFEAINRTLVDNLPDLHSQVAVLQRTVHMLTRDLRESSGQGGAVGAREAGALNPAPRTEASSADDYKYVGFEDQFRGSVDEIGARLAEYLPIFAGASDVLDIGCGRGEFLALLGSAGVSARGVDMNVEMVATARDRGLDAVRSDALAYVTSLPDTSLGGLFAAQVVEHLEPAYLMRLLEAAFQKLGSGAPLVIETINPQCWLAFFSSYLRDFTHVRAIHPDTLAYLARASGFTRVSVRYSAPVPEHMRMHMINVPAELASSGDPTAAALIAAARVLNRNADILNKHAFSFQDYAVIGYRS
jgi:SAM-dependent methyltransferase